MRGPALGLWVLLGFGLGCVSTATNSEVPTPSPALAQALVLSGPERMAQGGCAKYDVTVLDQSGNQLKDMGAGWDHFKS